MKFHLLKKESWLKRTQNERKTSVKKAVNSSDIVHCLLLTQAPGLRPPFHLKPSVLSCHVYGTHCIFNTVLLCIKKTRGQNFLYCDLIKIT